MTSLPLAHEMWFPHDAFPMDWSFAGQTLTLVLLAVAVVATVAVRLVARLWPGADVPALARLAPFMPFAVRLHLAVSLVGLLSMGDYLSPDMDLPATPAGVLLGAAMFGVSAVLQRIDLLGLAVFVLVAGAGRWSADFEQGRAGDPSPLEAARAIWALKVGAGVALIVVAFVEKLANPQLALSFLAEHPQLNVAQQIGLGIGDLEFIRAAGVIEVLFGLLLISGALPQVCVLVAGIPFNATLWFFGETELVGHLPVYGAMLVLLVYGSEPVLREGVRALWPWPAPGAVRRTAVKA